MKINNITPRVPMNTQGAITARKTTDTSFGAKLQNGLSATAGALGGAASLAGAALGQGGGTIISAALAGAKGIGSSSSALTANAANTSGGAGALSGGTASMNGQTLHSGPPKTGGTNASGFSEAERMLQQSTANNLKFLGLQNQQQSESRQFMTLSNVMKVRHSTASSTIRNING